MSFFGRAFPSSRLNSIGINDLVVQVTFYPLSICKNHINSKMMYNSPLSGADQNVVGSCKTQFNLFMLYNRENILKTAKALVEDTKTLVAGAASNQEQLANAAQMSVLI